MSEKFKVPSNTFKRWLDLDAQNVKLQRKFKNGEIEEEIYDWCLEEIKKNGSLSVRGVQAFGKKVSKNNKFKGSKTWAQNFLRRRGLLKKKN